MSETLYHWGLVVLFVSAAVSLVMAVLVTAPYGRHDRKGWGPHMNTRAAWVVMECPSSVLFAVVFLSGPHRFELVPLVLFGLWEVHYLHRTFVYPFLIKSSARKRTTVLIVALGFALNVVNSYVNAIWIGTLGTYLPAWTRDPRFLAGVGLFTAGFYVNKKADAMLRELRRPGGSEYVIPHGWLYDRVSCPNYLGEIMTWTGWALATWSLGGLAFMFLTIANLAPRAVSNHRWYRQTFPDYPSERRALIPYVL